MYIPIPEPLSSSTLSAPQDHSHFVLRPLRRNTHGKAKNTFNNFL